jgi:hypothetical protein
VTVHSGSPNWQGSTQAFGYSSSKKKKKKEKRRETPANWLNQQYRLQKAAVTPVRQGGR